MFLLECLGRDNVTVRFQKMEDICAMEMRVNFCISSGGVSSQPYLLSGEHFLPKMTEEALEQCFPTFEGL